MYKRILICSCIVIIIIISFFNYFYEVVAFHLSHDELKSDIKVMTFNIRSHGKGFDPISVTKFILERKSDIVVVNEYNDSAASKLDSLLLLQFHYRTRKDDGRCIDLLYSKYPIIKSYKLKKKGLQSLASGTILNINDKKVCVFFCHLSSNNTDGWNMQKASKENTETGWKISYNHYKKSQMHRIEEVDNMCHYIDSVKNNPILIVGDMNDFSYSKTLKQFRENGYNDAWWTNGFGYGATYKYKFFRLRIDHILYSSDITPINMKVIDSGTLSDHNALMGTFRIE